jgi:hypothetical protein
MEGSLVYWETKMAFLPKTYVYKGIGIEFEGNAYAVIALYWIGTVNGVTGRIG